MPDPVPPQRQYQIKGGRKVRHVVLCSEDQEQRLQQRAASEGVTVAKLMVDSALGDSIQVSRRTLFGELAAIRTMFNVALTLHSLKATEDALAALKELDRKVASA